MFEIRDKISVPLLSADKFIDAKDVTILPHVLKSMSSEPLKEKCAGYNDPIFYIYTSGTTGWLIFSDTYGPLIPFYNLYSIL